MTAILRHAYNIIVIATCCFLYSRAVIVLQKSSTINRKRLLTFVFATNLASWVLTVLPHLIFIDFVDHNVEHFPVFLQHVRDQQYFIELTSIFTNDDPEKAARGAKIKRIFFVKKFDLLGNRGVNRTM